MSGTSYEYVFDIINDEWSWKDRAHPLHAKLLKLVETAYTSDQTLPINPLDVFKIFSEITPSQVKMIWIGQDPYPRARDAKGIAFHAPENYPTSFKNIADNLAKYAHITHDQHRSIMTANMIPFVRNEGILLCNMASTVLTGTPTSHLSIWGEAIIQMLEPIQRDVPVVLFGIEAESLSKHFRWCVAFPHPSIQADAFADIDVFGEINKLCTSAGVEHPNWACIATTQP